MTDEEIRQLVEFVSAQGAPAFDPAIQNQLESSAQAEEEVSEEDEMLVEKCLEIIRQEKAGVYFDAAAAAYAWVTPALLEWLISWSAGAFWAQVTGQNHGRY